jgi:hypothetical protein
MTPNLLACHLRVFSSPEEDEDGVMVLCHMHTEMFNRTTLRKFIAPRRQARKGKAFTYFSEPWRLCVFARVTGVSDCIWPNWFINFKYLCLGLSFDLNLFPHISGI